MNHASLFHDECLDCQPYFSSNNGLCPFCQHLRLRHFFCYRGESSPSISISLDGQEYPPLLAAQPSDNADDPTRDCRLCRMVRHDNAMQEKFCPRDPNFNGGPGPGTDLLRITRRPTDGKRCLRIIRGYPFQVSDLHQYAPQDAPSLLARTVSWDQITGWLDGCASTHSNCESHTTSAPTYFRLIDVRRKKLIVGDVRYRFAALSYVWGQNPDPSKLKAELSNIELLERDGGVDTSRLPATIADAIEACRHLQIDYFWVDRLCIVQDDDENKQQQFDEMASIYAAAHLVIVVTEGDMDAGIPGIRPRYPEIQRQVEIDGLVLIHEVLGFELGSTSEWNSRAWTYQESLFARRRLYFTPVQAFFECDETKYYEDHTQSDERVNGSLRVNQNVDIPDIDMWAFHLWAYTGRTLSHSSDIYNAFAGIEHALIGKGASFCGLPRGSFNEALLWHVREKDWEEKRGKKRPNSGHLLLPSWSWSSVEAVISDLLLGEYFVGTLVTWEYQKGSIFCPVQDDTALSKRLLDEYSNKDQDHGGPLWESPGAKSKSTICMYPSTETQQRLYKIQHRSNALIILALAWLHGCLETSCPFPDLKDCTFLELTTELESHWDSYEAFEREVVRNRPDNILSEQLESSDLWPETTANAGLTKSTLRGRVQSSFFHFDRDGKATTHILILDSYGCRSGYLSTNIEEARALNLLSSERPKEELIALSLGCLPSSCYDIKYCVELGSTDEDLWKKVKSFMSFFHPDDEGHPDEEWWRKNVAPVCAALGRDGLDLSFVDRDGSAMVSIPVVYVMLIRWNGPVAYRVSVGWMLLTAWVQSNRQFKTVYLD